jgi:hypothetical protein
VRQLEEAFGVEPMLSGYGDSRIDPDLQHAILYR